MLRIIRHPCIGVKETFGRFKKLLAPGWHLYIPFISRIYAYDTRVFNTHKKITTKTLDNVFCELKVSTFWRIAEPALRHYAADDPHNAISATLEDKLRNFVASKKLDDLFRADSHIKEEEIDGVDVLLQRSPIQEQLLLPLNEFASSFGIKITSIAITDIEPDANVRLAMNGVNAALRERQASQERAEANKVALVREAEADAERKKLHGQGIADMRRAIIDGYKGSVDNMAQSLGITPQQAIAMTLTTQYVEALSDLAKSKNTKVLFFSQDAAHTIQDVTKQFGLLLVDKVLAHPQQ